MAEGTGFLLVMMEPPAALEEEFNAWYDTEHVPERLAVPGFESATRYVCVAGWPRYVAHYDLASPAVIDSPAYEAISGDRFSPWTKRMLARVRGFYRVFGEQTIVGPSCIPHSPDVPAGRVLLIRASGAASITTSAWADGARAAFEPREDFRDLRVLRAAPAQGADLLALVRLDGSRARESVDLSAFGPIARHVDLCNEYVPWRASTG